MTELALINAKIITVDKNDSFQQAVLIDGRRIKAVGTDDEIMSLASPDAQVVNLQDRSLVPGFIDAHNHLTHQGAAFNAVDFSYPAVASIDDLRKAISHAVEYTQKGKWIRGWGLNYEKFADARQPTRWDIDDISPEHPVCAVHVSGHNVLVNSVALNQANVSDATPDPDGGKFARDEQDRISGYAYDSAQQLVVPTSVNVGHHGPDIGYDLPLEELVDDIDRACQAYIKAGITSIVDPQVTTREMPGYMAARKQGKLTVKVTCMYLSNHQAAINELGITDHIGNDQLSIGPMKYYCDGTLIGGTALFYPDEPVQENGCRCHVHDAGRGYTYWPDIEAFKETLIDTHGRGLQFGIHTQGDMALDIVIDAIEQAQKRFPRDHARHRIEHCHGATKEQIAKIKQLGMIPITQPGQLYETGDDLTQMYGEKRARYFIPLRDMIDAGIPAVVSTDAFVQSYKPLDAIHAAVNRRSLTGRDMGQDQSISVLEAIRAYTHNAAYSVYQEKNKGSIEVGKLADMAIIDTDILSVATEEIAEQDIYMTISNGEIVYQKQR